MAAKVTNEQEHEQALERIAELRAEGAKPEKGTELADLEAAIAGYSAREDEPLSSKGRPKGSILGD